MPTPSVGRKMAPCMPCSSISASRASRSRYSGCRHRLEVAEQRVHVLAPRVAAAEVLVERAGLGDRVERRVRDEPVDLPADEQALLAVDLAPTAWRASPYCGSMWRVKASIAS